MSHAKRKTTIRALVTIVLSLSVLSAIVFAQQIRDQIVVWTFEPTAQLTSVADELTLRDRGEFYLYASQPEIIDAATFNTRCERQEADFYILGCYVGQKIYVYDIDNPALDGVVEITAAHEMLHAVWERLPERERSRLATELEAAYQQIKTPDLEERLTYYERAEPGERANELHSILATEVATLTPALETYYAEIFADRAAVVAVYEGYASVLRDINDEITTLGAELEAELPALNTAIDAQNTAVEQLSAEIDAHNQAGARVDRYDGAAVDAYNARQAALNARQATLTAAGEALEARIARYNDKRDRYNAIVIRSDQLTTSLDSVKSLE